MDFPTTDEKKLFYFKEFTDTCHFKMHIHEGESGDDCNTDQFLAGKIGDDYIIGDYCKTGWK